MQWLKLLIHYQKLFILYLNHLQTTKHNYILISDKNTLKLHLIKGELHPYSLLVSE